MILPLIIVGGCLPIILWQMLKKAQQKQLEAEAQLLIHKEFFNEAINKSVLATDYLVEKIINGVLDRMEAKHQPEVRAYIKNVVIREIGYLRHVDPGFYRCLGTFNKDR